MPDRWDVGVIHGLIWFGLDPYVNLRIVSKEPVYGVQNKVHCTPGVFCLADVRTLTRQPQHDVVRADFTPDVHRLQASIDRVLAVLFVIRRITAVDRFRRKPEPWRNELGHELSIFEHLPDFTRPTHDFGG